MYCAFAEVDYPTILIAAVVSMQQMLTPYPFGLGRELREGLIALGLATEQIGMLETGELYDRESTGFFPVVSLLLIRK